MSRTAQQPLLPPIHRPQLSKDVVKAAFIVGILFCFIAIIVHETKYKSDCQEADLWQLERCNTTRFSDSGRLDFISGPCFWSQELMFECSPQDCFCLAENQAFFGHTWPCYRKPDDCQDIPLLDPIDTKHLPSFAAFMVFLCAGLVLIMSAGFHLFLDWYCPILY